MDLRRGQRLCRGPPGLRRLRGRSRATELPAAGPALAGDHPGGDAQGPRELRRLPKGGAGRAAACRHAGGEFEGLDGAGRLRFFLDSDRRPEVDGNRSNRPPGWLLHSPFVRQALGSRTVEIAEGAGPCNCASTECPSRQLRSEMVPMETCSASQFSNVVRDHGGKNVPLCDGQHAAKLGPLQVLAGASELVTDPDDIAYLSCESADTVRVFPQALFACPEVNLYGTGVAAVEAHVCRSTLRTRKFLRRATEQA